jgi:hypothetical protein
MKRQFQLFALLLTALLAGGPSLAAAACALNNLAMGADCPMGMAEMGADCPMAQDLTTADCSQDCCNRAQSQAVVIPGIPVRPKLLVATLHFALLAELPRVETASIESEPLRVSSSPPRYILLRVFRI